MALKELEIKYAALRQRPYKLTDGGGLYLLVMPSGSKLWRLKYRYDGKEKQLSFGGYPDVPTAAARQMRKGAKALIEQGIDPATVKKAAKRRPVKLHLFEPIARAWHANRADGLDEAHAKRVLRRMERDVFPLLGGRDIGDIRAPDILEVVRAVEARGALDISRRLKQAIGQVFRFAIASGWTEHDPTTSINAALKPKPRVRHMARVPLAELPDLVGAISSYDGEADPRRRETTRDALLFTLLTWARTTETRFMTWDELEDLDGTDPVWRVPAERMKMEREHLVPLSRPAVEILLRRRRTSNDPYVFPGDKAMKPISENTMLYACYRMGYKGRQTVHGFRGLASTWANEAEIYRPDWIEMALSHADEDEVRGAYNSALYLSARKRMLADWAAVILGTDGKNEAPAEGQCYEKPRRQLPRAGRHHEPPAQVESGRFGAPFWRTTRRGSQLPR